MGKHLLTTSLTHTHAAIIPSSHPRCLWQNERFACFLNHPILLLFFFFLNPSHLTTVTMAFNKLLQLPSSCGSPLETGWGAREERGREREKGWMKTREGDNPVLNKRSNCWIEKLWLSGGGTKWNRLSSFHCVCLCLCERVRVCEVDRFLGLFTLELEVLTAKAQKTVRGLSACVCAYVCVAGGFLCCRSHSREASPLIQYNSGAQIVSLINYLIYKTSIINSFVLFFWFLFFSCECLLSESKIRTALEKLL